MKTTRQELQKLSVFYTPCITLFQNNSLQNRFKTYQTINKNPSNSDICFHLTKVFFSKVISNRQQCDFYQFIHRFTSTSSTIDEISSWTSNDIKSSQWRWFRMKSSICLQFVCRLQFQWMKTSFYATEKRKKFVGLLSFVWIIILMEIIFKIPEDILVVSSFILQNLFAVCSNVH
jgi:hypothetical protein